MTFQNLTRAARRSLGWHPALRQPATARGHAPRHAESALSRAELQRLVAGMID